MGRTEQEVKRETDKRKKNRKSGKIGKTGALKRGIALFLAVLMTESVMADTGISHTRAQEEAVSQAEAEPLENADPESGEQNALQGYQILGIGELPEEIQMQTLPVGGKETDIKFPDQLTVTAKELLTSGTEEEGEENISPENPAEPRPSGADTGKEDAEKEDTGKADTEKEDAGKADTEKEDTGKADTEKEDTGKADTEKEDTGKADTEKEDAGKADTEKEDAEKADTEKEVTGEEVTSGESTEKENSTENENPESGNVQGSGTGNTGETIITQAAAALCQFADAFRPMTVYAAEEEQTAEGETVELTLSGITWKLDPAESDFTEFDGSQNGSAYTYTPVLPEANEDGTPLLLDETVELPVICVLVGEMQVSLLSNGGEFELNNLPIDNQWNFVINSQNMNTYNDAVLTGGFSDFTDNNGQDQKSSWKGIVIDGVQVNLTIKDVTIDRYKSGDDKFESTDAAITLRNGATLNLTLEGVNYLEGATGGAGICVEEGSTLQITRKSTGTLHAVGGDHYGGAAGIGANGTGWVYNGSEGTVQKLGCIVINGGTITADGGTQMRGTFGYSSAAGIGGSDGGTTGSIEINGGTITATGGSWSAGIGGGSNGYVPSIVITGGTITAVAPGTDTIKHRGAAIGAGEYYVNAEEAPCGTIRISGGTIIAQGNIGLGNIRPVGGTTPKKTGSVEIGANATLNCDGIIDPAPAGSASTTYTLSFTIYDGRISRATRADLSLNGTTLAQNVEAAVNTPGTAVIKTKVMSGVLTGGQKIGITLDGRSYEATVHFQDGQTEYNTTIGTELYPVKLEFYDPAITQDITVSAVEVKQDGEKLDEADYYAPAQITKQKTHYGTMVLYLPAGTGNTEISVTAESLNQGKAMTKDKQSISGEGANTIRMLEPEITLKAELLEVNQGKARLRITSNYAGITLYYVEKKEGETPTPEEVRKGESIQNFKGTSKEITVSCANTSEHHFYLVAELDGAISDVAAVSFGSNPSVELIKQGETQGVKYDSLTQAIQEAANYPGCTVKLLRDLTLTERINIYKGSFTIDLNGKSMEIQYSGKTLTSGFFMIYFGASVTWKDSTGNGKVTGNIQGMPLFGVNGTLVIQGGDFERAAGNIGGQDGYGTIRIEGGEFDNDITLGSQTNYAESLSGGIFRGTVKSTWGTTAALLKRGHRYRTLSDQSVSAGTADTAGSVSNVEVIALTPIAGTLTLSEKECEWGQKITATYTPAAGETGEKYIYRWYMVKAGKEQDLTNKEGPTEKTSSTYTIHRQTVGAEIYCEVEAEGTNHSGAMTTDPVKVLPKDIGAKGTDGKDKLHVKIKTKDFTGAPLTLTGSDIQYCWYGSANNSSKLSLGTDLEIIEDTYVNNVQPSTADGKASVKIRGTGAYRGEYMVTFEIVEKDIEAKATVSPDDWTNQAVTVSAPDGYLICRKTEEGYDYEKGFAGSFTVTEGSTSPDGITVSYRLKEKTAPEGKDGAVSEEKTVQVKLDQSAPYFDGEGDGITVEDSTFRELLKKITFGFYTRTKEGTIQATDDVSGVAEYYYYVDKVTDKENYQILSTEQLDSYVQNGSFQKAARGKFSLSDEANQVVYAYAADHAGNRSGYICTEGLVVDTTAPDMRITNPAKEDGTLKDTEATIGVELNEDAALLFFYEYQSDFMNAELYQQYVKAVNDYMNSEPQYRQFLKTENGKQVPTVTEADYTYSDDAGRYCYYSKQIQTVDQDSKIAKDIKRHQSLVFRMEGKKGKNDIILDAHHKWNLGLKPNTNCTVWMAAVDSAGNITVQKTAFTTAKAMPTMTEPPVVNGTYGDAAKDLTITKAGVAQYNGTTIDGTWKVTDTGTAVLPMNRTAKCQVTFTPDTSYDGKYEPAVFEVTPVLAKHPVEVVIINPSKTYGMEMPLLWQQYGKINKETLNRDNNELVTPDDEQSLLKSLRWVTKAAKDSPAGQYEYTVTSDSPKYEVTAVYYDNSTGKYDESKGILTITKALGELERTADFKDGQAVQYQGGNQGAFRLGVKANHNEIPLHYEVTEARGINGEVIAGEDISSQLLAIAPDGTVTPKGTGMATITVSLPESRNYTAAVEKMTISVEIGKGNVRPVQVAGSTLTYGEPLSSVEFSEAVFADASDSSVTVPGTIKWKTPDVKPEAGSYEAEYIFTPCAASDPSWENNYNTYEGKVTVTVNKAKATFKKAPVPGDRIYNPQLALSELLLNEKAKVQSAVTGIDGNFIDGDWEFINPEVEMTPLQQIGVGTRSYEIHYVPNEDPAYERNYDFSDTRKTVQITVKKAVPYISVPPTVKAYTHGDYLYNQKLSVPDGAVIIGDGKGEAGAGSPDTQIPVPGTFTWKTPQTQLSHTESRGKEYEYVFTPEDTESYETVTGKIRITVNKAADPPLMPGDSRDVAHSCVKVSDVELPQGWAWKEADRETPLEVGKTVTAVALYQAADAGNYENTSVSIRITRSSCDHAKTEVRNARKATCMAEGHTGETWCLICKEKLDDGDVIPKDPANHTALTETVIRQATTAREGLTLWECRDCGYRVEAAIPKLPGGNTGGGTAGGSSGQQSGGAADSPEENQGSGSSSQGISPTGTAPAPAAAAAGNTPSKTDALTFGAASKPTYRPTASANSEEVNNRETQEPFIKGENGKEGWQAIESWVGGTQEGETIQVDMDGTTVVPGTVFDRMKGRDITVTFDMGGGILWTVNGLDVTAQNAKDIDFGVTMGKQAGSGIPVDVINNVTGERYSVNLTLTHNGEFGFTAVLTVNMDAANAGLYANLFYYNPASGELEFMCAGKINEEGNVELTFSHASDYTVVIDTMPMDESVQDAAGEEAGAGQGGSDDTGADRNSGQSFDNGGSRILVGAVIVLIVLAAFGTVYVLRRRRVK